jgi:mRNA interferase RelE/StbE
VPYSLKIKGSALKEIERLTPANRRRVVAAIDGLRHDPGAGTLLKGQLTGLRRIRVGSLRIIYEVRNEELVILVLRVGHRRDVYR